MSVSERSCLRSKKRQRARSFFAELLEDDKQRQRPGPEFILSKAKDLAVDPKRGLVKGPGPSSLSSSRTTNKGKGQVLRCAQATGDGRQETGDRRQETGDRRQETGDRRRATG
jgi:hypothetical protein